MPHHAMVTRKRRASSREEEDEEKKKRADNNEISSKDKLDKLAAWASECGFDLGGNVSLEEVEGMGGAVVAKSDLNADEVVVRVPPEYIIDGSYIKVPRQDEPIMLGNILGLCLQHCVENGEVKREDRPRLRVVLHLLCEKFIPKLANFEPYVNALPETIRGIPKENDLLIDGTHLQSTIRKRREKVEAWHRALFSKNPAKMLLPEWRSLDTFAWACDIFFSRAIRVPLGPFGQDLECLVPVMDMMNHRHGAISRIERCPDGRLGVKIASRTSAGDQLCINYGALSNECLLSNFGFAIKDNPCDVVYLDGGRMKLFRESIPQETFDRARKMDMEYPPPPSQVKADPRRVTGMQVYGREETVEFDMRSAIFDDDILRDIGEPLCGGNERGAIAILLDLIERCMSKILSCLQRETTATYACFFRYYAAGQLEILAESKERLGKMLAMLEMSASHNK